MWMSVTGHTQWPPAGLSHAINDHDFYLIQIQSRVVIHVYVRRPNVQL